MGDSRGVELVAQASDGAASQPVTVITGPTAVGKSALALAIAERTGAEIVSADSRQVYRYMDVGTAKPSIAERAHVAHHLVDVVYPNEPYSIADYQRDAGRALDAIAARGRPALLVGGSPHYIQAVIDRLRPAPRFPALREWLERADVRDRLRLDQWLWVLDPTAAAEIDSHNRRRVLRALEIILGSGRRFSEIGRQRHEAIPAVWIGLRRERPALYELVARRLDAMLEAGWLAEVRTLLAMGYSVRCPSMSATGYAELAAVLRREQSLERAKERILYATHAFIRRQDAWLRKEERVHWFDADNPRLVERVLQCAFGVGA